MECLLWLVKILAFIVTKESAIQEQLHIRGVYELNIDSPLPVELKSFMASAKEDNIYL